MNVVPIVTAVALIAVSVFWAVVLVKLSSKSDFEKRTLLRRPVIVNAKTKKAFKGVIWEKRDPYVVMRDVALHENGQWRGVDGEVIVHVDTIDFVQVLAEVGD